MHSDERLVKKALLGDKRALGKLLSRYQDQIFFLLYDIFGDYEQANDVVQKIFQKTSKSLNTFKNKITFSSWIYRMAIDTSLKIQQKHPRGHGTDVETKLPPQQFNGSNTGTKKNNKIYESEIQSALVQLSWQQRITIILYYFHKRSVKEVADIMQWREDIVRTHIQRAVDKLRTTLPDNTRL